jgi:UDP-glucose 4-epimerase
VTPKVTDDIAGSVALISGAAGFIGSRLCRVLAAAGARVHGAGRRTTGGLGAGIEYHSVDLVDDAETRRLMREAKPDFVFHLASHVKGAPDIKHVLPTFRSNLQTTVNLLTTAAEFGCRRIVVAGSLVEPEPAHGGERVPSSPYAAAKWASSDYSRMFHGLYGLPVVIARVFMVYGPGQQDETKLIPYTIRCLARDEAPDITSGRRQIDWVYVDDVVDGLVALALAPDIEGATLDLGSGSLTTTADLVETICSLMRSRVLPRFGAVPDRPLEPTRVASVAATTTQTGWVPRVPLEQGLLRSIEWYSSAATARADG